MASEVESTVLKCNACWATLGGGAECHKTPCNHLFCRGCVLQLVSKAEDSTDPRDLQVHTGCLRCIHHLPACVCRCVGVITDLMCVMP